jgi:hypothetical protein
VVLSKREKNIGLAAGAAVVGLLLYSFVWSPYSDALGSIAQEKADAEKTLADGEQLNQRKAHLQPIWQQLVQGGVRQDESLAQSQAREALDNWAQRAGVTLDSLVLEHSVQQGSFFVTNFNMSFGVAGATGMRSIAQMMWALETAKIPMRVNDMKISPAHEGTDQLNVKLSVSTLYTASESPAGLGGGNSATRVQQ